MKTNQKLSYKKGGFVVPIAIATLVVASIGLLAFSWWGWGGEQKTDVVPVTSITKKTDTAKRIVKTPDHAVLTSTANDDKTLDSDGAAIEAGLKGLDGANVDITNSLNDTPASL